jgi:hypothetical protein
MLQKSIELEKDCKEKCTEGEFVILKKVFFEKKRICKYYEYKINMEYATTSYNRIVYASGLKALGLQ